MSIDKVDSLGGEFVRKATGVGRGIKGWISRVLTAMKLPAPLVKVLTWAILIFFGLLVLAVIVFAVFAIFVMSRGCDREKSKIQTVRVI